MTFKFKEYTILSEAIKDMNRQQFIEFAGKLFDEGDERVLNKVLDLGADLKVDDIIAETFATKLPKAENGADEKLANEIKKLSIAGEAKVKLAEGMRDGKAYDILGLVKRARKSETAISSCVNSSYSGAMDLLPWLVEWKAKPDAGTRGVASTEIFMISCGKNGTTPPKGDCMVDGVVIESKSSKSGYGGEFSISGQQHSFRPRVETFKANLSQVFAKKGIQLDDHNKYGLGSGASGAISGAGGKSMTTALNETIKVLRKAGMKDATIDKTFQKLINDSFSYAKSNLSLSVMNGGEIDLHSFLTLWNAVAYDEYKSEEGFQWAIFFNRSSGNCVSFKEPQDIIDFKDRLKLVSISYAKGIGQNQSIGGFSIK